MVIYSQRDARWAKHVLGWGPHLGTMGDYGCFVTCCAMIATDSGLHTYPSALDVLFTAKRIFLEDPTGTMDLAPDRALDLAYPGLFQTVAFAGYRPDLINKALPTKHSYAMLWISTIGVPTHFVIAYSANAKTIADPWTGHAGYLSSYGGTSAVHKTIIVTYLPPKPVLSPTVPVVPPVDVPPPGVPPTPVVLPDPQPIPCPTPPPPQTAIDRLTTLIQALLIALGRQIP